ncbi:MAG: holo-ACP synthase [Oscillospiraceae bacterium]|nr:holo-ACP synthase [Oscillospiraceae bacterium]
MYTIGIDMTTVSRIEKSCEKDSFRRFVFSEKELAVFFDREKPKYASLAANFAAKEAFGKALGTGVRGFDLNEVEILRDEMGAPYFNFYGRAAEIMLAGGYTARVSLSHEKDTAIAMVILEKGINIKKL